MTTEWTYQAYDPTSQLGNIAEAVKLLAEVEITEQGLLRADVCEERKRLVETLTRFRQQHFGLLPDETAIPEGTRA